MQKPSDLENFDESEKIFDWLNMLDFEKSEDLEIKSYYTTLNQAHYSIIKCL